MARSRRHLHISVKKGRSGREAVTESNPFDRDLIKYFCGQLLLAKSPIVVRRGKCFVAQGNVREDQEDREIASREAPSELFPRMTAIKLQPFLTVTMGCPTTSNRQHVTCPRQCVGSTATHGGPLLMDVYLWEFPADQPVECPTDSEFENNLALIGRVAPSGTMLIS
jgi:hypothetical protein